MGAETTHVSPVVLFQEIGTAITRKFDLKWAQKPPMCPLSLCFRKLELQRRGITTRNGRRNIRSGLDRFDRAEGVTLLEIITNLGKVHEDDVTKGSLSKVGDANGGNLAINLAILVRWDE